MSTATPITKAQVLETFDAILDRGCLTPEQRTQLRNGEDVDGAIIQQSGGSSGATPLRLPRTRDELQWLGMQVLSHHVHRYGSMPKRVAFLGGVSHLEASQRVELDQPVRIENFAGDEIQKLDAYDPDVISMYPSFAREIVANPHLRLDHVKSVKLGGEPILPSDLDKLRARFPDVVIIEQFGSTEMPGVAFRTFEPGASNPYEVCSDRYTVHLKAGDGWQPLYVEDRFPDRAFPIEGSYDTGDEVRVENGAILEVRRRGDAAYPLLGAIDELLVGGCVNVQVLSQERLLLCAPQGATPPSPVTIGDMELDARIEPPFRLVDSNKMPLFLDTQRVDSSRLYRSASGSP